MVGSEPLRKMGTLSCADLRSVDFHKPGGFTTMSQNPIVIRCLVASRRPTNPVCGVDAPPGCIELRIFRKKTNPIVCRCLVAFERKSQPAAV